MALPCWRHLGSTRPPLCERSVRHALARNHHAAAVSATSPMRREEFAPPYACTDSVALETAKEFRIDQAIIRRRSSCRRLLMSSAGAGAVVLTVKVAVVGAGRPAQGGGFLLECPRHGARAGPLPHTCTALDGHEHGHGAGRHPERGLRETGRGAAAADDHEHAGAAGRRSTRSRGRGRELLLDDVLPVVHSWRAQGGVALFEEADPAAL